MFPSDVKDKLKACFSSQEWRLNNLYYIIDREGKKVLFKCRPQQKMLFDDMKDFNIILKARQLGFSTAICIYILDSCLFKSNVRAAIITHTREDSQFLFRDKIKFAYNSLPAMIKKQVQADTNTSSVVYFSNNSNIRVGTSMRSSTLNILHVSELGKISVKYPEKAREIKTGAFNAIHDGQKVFVESTAEGKVGLFYELCKAAENNTLGNNVKMFFFPWHDNPDYRLSNAKLNLTDSEREYFDRLKTVKELGLTMPQKYWYVNKWRKQRLGGGDSMHQEYPSYPEEAFEIPIVGAYFGKEIAKLYDEGRITSFSHEPSVPVNTFWDIGYNDTTAIWFHQRIGLEDRFIDYYEQNGEVLAHYVKMLTNKPYVYGGHFLPHDIKVHDISRPDRKSRLEVLAELGLRNLYVVPKAKDLSNSVEMIREVLPSCWFEKEKCADGLSALENYRKTWSDALDRFTKPFHNWASNGTDAFRMFATGYIPELKKSKGRERQNWKTV